MLAVYPAVVKGGVVAAEREEAVGRPNELPQVHALARMFRGENEPFFLTHGPTVIASWGPRHPGSDPPDTIGRPYPF